MFETGGMNVTTAGSSQNGFIATLGDAWDKTVDKVATEILPNWVEKTLNDQLGISHLDQPTYNQQAAPPRQDLAENNTIATAQKQGLLHQAMSLVDNVNIGSGAVLAVGVLILGAVVAVKLYKKM